jgi:hypothetical protein
MTTHTISTLNNGVLRQSKSDCIISSGGHINYHISTKILTNFNKGTLLPCLLPFGFVVQENMFTADKYKVMTMTVFHRPPELIMQSDLLCLKTPLFKVDMVWVVIFKVCVVFVLLSRNKIDFPDIISLVT